MTTPFAAAGLLTLAFGLNLPLGRLRAKCKRFSWQWLVCIHLAVPLLALARYQWELSWVFAPVCILCALFGQLAGARLQRGNQRS